MQQDRGRSDRSERGEDAHVPHVLYQPRRQQRAEKKPAEITGHDDAGRRGGKALLHGTNTEQRGLQPIAQHDEAHAEEERPGSGDQGHHLRKTSCIDTGGPRDGGAVILACDKSDQFRHKTC
jgi:hypothetical protein